MAQTPTDPTKAQVWVTKGLDDLDFEFYFPQGPKGDPGGFTYGTDLGSANLNTIVTSGMYRTSGTSVMNAGNNFPVNLAGVLVVYERLRDATFQSVFQEYHVADSVNGMRVKYERYMFGNGTWTTWRAFNSTRVDQTAGRAIYQWDDLNGREQLIYGDTGWRNLDGVSAWNDALFLPGSVTQAGGYGAKIRRTGYMVELNVGIDKAASGAPTMLSAFPIGFRPAAGAPLQAIGGTSGLSMFRVFHAGGTSGMIYQSTSAIVGGSVTIVFSTVDAWPTSLPGVSIVGAPNI